MEQITRTQAQYAMEHGEFDSTITGAAPRVAVILTQSWCPQWHEMRRFLAEYQGGAVFYLEYDKSDLFDAFRSFKEKTFDNDQIPYLRYYRDGKLVGTSNAVPEARFHAYLEKLTQRGRRRRCWRPPPGASAFSSHRSTKLDSKRACQAGPPALSNL